MRWSVCLLLHLRRKIELDPISILTISRQQPTERIKTGLLMRLQMPRLPQNMSACQRGMPAQFNFDRGSKPAQLKAISLFEQKSCFGQVHLPGHILHPTIILWLGQYTYCCRVACKRPVCKCIYLENCQSHKCSPLKFRIGERGCSQISFSHPA